MLDIIRREIERSPHFAINYEQYMNLVLYHPEKGYYNREQQKIGRNGDFYTSSSLSDLFGMVWANWFYESIKRNDLKPIICEIGAGNGSFAKSMLEELKKTHPDFYHEVEYLIIEASPYHRGKITDCLRNEPVSIFSSIEECQSKVPDFCGVIFCNELLDALPVRVVEQSKSMLYEMVVTLNERSKLSEKKVVCKDENVISWIEKYVGRLNQGQRIEIPLKMTEWLLNLYGWIKQAVIVFVDYGYTRSQWKEPILQSGSLRGYMAHQMISDPILYPGEMDLTSHVHWDAVKMIGREHGANCKMFQSQGMFLLENGILNHLQETINTDPFSKEHKQNRAIRSLVLSSMADQFQVMIQKKTVT
ncbi:SAM-dependent methyltransferase [Fictibacillus sp. Mic-4]|uniref:class I SAM-dependent methyltransferase n=1 Tax=Fictibacillus sp. Mic-4 TaxID=3132826 RepID=UPI003CF24C4B